MIIAALLLPVLAIAGGNTCANDEEAHYIAVENDGNIPELNGCHDNKADSCACMTQCQQDNNHLSFEWKGGDDSVGEYELAAYTSSNSAAGSGGAFYVSFMVDGSWTAKEKFFEGAERKALKTKLFTTAFPGQVRLTTDSTDGWNFWKVTFNGATIYEDPKGDGGAAEDHGFWLDADDANYENTVKVIDVPNCCCFVNVA